MRLTSLTIAICALCLAAPAARGQSKPAGPSLVGTWRLVSFEDRPAKGEVQKPFGAQPKGLLVYDATGHMSMQIMRVPHPKVSTTDEQKLKPEEKAALFDAYVAYFGTYTVDAARKIVTHHVEGDFAEVYVGRDEHRPYELAGDRLTLKPKWEAFGTQWQGVRVFERMKPK